MTTTTDTLEGLRTAREVYANMPGDHDLYAYLDVLNNYLTDEIPPQCVPMVDYFVNQAFSLRSNNGVQVYKTTDDIVKGLDYAMTRVA